MLTPSEYLTKTGNHALDDQMAGMHSMPLETFVMLGYMRGCIETVCIYMRPDPAKAEEARAMLDAARQVIEEKGELWNARGL